MWECLLEITFQCSQHKIDFGRVLGSILEGFGLHFGRFFGAKREKVVSLSGILRKPKKRGEKKESGKLRQIPGKLSRGWSGPKNPEFLPESLSRETPERHSRSELRSLPDNSKLDARVVWLVPGARGQDPQARSCSRREC